MPEDSSLALSALEAAAATFFNWKVTGATPAMATVGDALTVKLPAAPFEVNAGAVATPFWFVSTVAVLANDPTRHWYVPGR
jgi:hypothetical protein